MFMHHLSILDRIVFTFQRTPGATFVIPSPPNAEEKAVATAFTPKFDRHLPKHLHAEAPSGTPDAFARPRHMLAAGLFQIAFCSEAGPTGYAF
jgi:hypothetical protein